MTRDKRDAIGWLAASSREIMAANGALMSAMTEAMRRKGAEIRELPRPAPRISPPPPVSAELHGFGQSIAEKVAAIDRQLQPDERERLCALAPGFLYAVLRNEPDVEQAVTMLLAMDPGWAALWVRANLELLERRFAP